MNYDHMTLEAQEAFARAHDIASRYAHPIIDDAHLLLALLDPPTAELEALFAQAHADPTGLVRWLKTRLKSSIASTEANGDHPSARYVSQDVIRAAALAVEEAEAMGSTLAGPLHTLLALCQVSRGSVAAALREHGLIHSALKKAGLHLHTPAPGVPTHTTSSSPTASEPAPESMLSRFGTDLIRQAESDRLDPIVGRDDEILRIIQILSRRTKNNPVLIGEPGVGKTAIVEGLAGRLAHGDVPEGLRGRRIVSLDLGAMLAGTPYRGDFEARFKELLQEVIESCGQIILFIDEMHMLMGAGGGDGAIDAANLLKPPLARGDIRCIGATTIDEYRRHIERDAALERRLQPLRVLEPSVEDSISILRGIKEKYELHHGVRIQDRALVAAVTLSRRYLPDRFLPDKAIDLIDEAAARIRVELDSAPAVIDSARRKLMQLQIERQSLTREDDLHSRERVAELDGEIADCREELELLHLHWKEERNLISQLRALQEEQGRKRQEVEHAMRVQDASRYVALDRVLNSLREKMTILHERLDALQERHRLLREDVGPEDIADIVARWTGIPVSKMLETEVNRLLHLEERLEARVVGQREALERVAGAMRRSRSGLADPDRPVGSFIFLGPTGVGKTETARALADVLFTDPRALIRLDMSEYMERHTVARLLGSPPGYVGHEQGSVLSRAIRERPYAVVLFDEIEKAHPDVFNILLQILEDGRLTDSQGRTLDFRNTVIILTTNLGAQARRPPDPSSEAAAGYTRDLLSQTFRPELLNRIDDIVWFKELDDTAIDRILDLHLERVQGRLADRRIRLELAPAARRRVLEEGAPAGYGARPLRRVLQRLVLDPLSILLLQGALEDECVVQVDLGSSGELRFYKRRNAG